MKSRVFKVIMLFLLVGIGFGFVSMFVSAWSLAWAWMGMGVFLVTGLIISVTIAKQLQWLNLKLGLRRCLFAALIIIAAYPASVLVMIIGQVAYESLYATAFPAEWQMRVYSGSFPYTTVPLYLGAVVGAALVSSALRVLSRRWEWRLVLLLVITGILTIPLSQSIAALIDERNWHRLLFPIGEGLFGALSGYWLLRASSKQKQLGSARSAASEPFYRPA